TTPGLALPSYSVAPRITTSASTGASAEGTKTHNNRGARLVMGVLAGSCCLLTSATRRLYRVAGRWETTLPFVYPVVVGRKLPDSLHCVMGDPPCADLHSMPRMPKDHSLRRNGGRLHHPLSALSFYSPGSH